MNILMLHNFYQQAGGEDAVMRAEADLLTKAGHSVTVETVDNHEIRGSFDKIRTTLRLANDPSRAVWMRYLLRTVRPDLVHVHNFFPLLTPAVHVAASRSGIPVVQTLHNYRLLCAGATFERDGQVCELCIRGTRLNAVRHRCYRNSVIASAALAFLQRRAVDDGLLVDHVNRFIALTEFARSKYVEGGLPPEKIVVKPNFIDRPEAPAAGEREGVLFVGRLSHEKGVLDLLRAWSELPDIPLSIAGDGPLAGEMARIAPPNVRLLGKLDFSDVEREMRRAAALVMPSIWFEGFPMTLVEAFANGLPAIVSRIGSLDELVEDGVNGAKFEPGDPASLAGTVRAAFADRLALVRAGERARRIYEERYGAARNLGLLEKIYQEAIRAVA